MPNPLKRTRTSHAYRIELPAGRFTVHPQRSTTAPVFRWPSADSRFRRPWNREDLYTQGTSRNGLDQLSAKLGLFEGVEQALGAYREIGERIGAGFVFDHSAGIHLAAGQLEAPIEAYRRAAEFRREIDHRPGAAANLRELGNVLRETGEPDGARDTLRAALALQRKQIRTRQPLYAMKSLVCLALD